MKKMKKKKTTLSAELKEVKVILARLMRQVHEFAYPSEFWLTYKSEVANVMQALQDTLSLLHPESGFVVKSGKKHHFLEAHRQNVNDLLTRLDRAKSHGR